ncbi:hypothetical protein MauCBS54593_001974 [Microsporum audouinii]
MQSRSASRGSQYIRGTRPKDRQHTQDQTQQTQEGVYQGYYDLNSPEHRQARYYSQDGQRKTADGQFQAYSPGASLRCASSSNISSSSSSSNNNNNNISNELPEDEPVYLPSIGSFQSLHSLVNNLPTPGAGAVDRQASVSAASTAASSAASTFRSDTFSFSNGRPLASRSNSSLDRPASVAVGGGSAAGIRQARTVAARPMSSAVRNESFHSNSSPVDRQAYQAVSAVRRATAAPRPICTAVRKDSYHAYSNSSPVAASPAASASSSSLDQGQAVNGQMQQPVIPAPTRRPPSPPPAPASAVAAAVTTAVTAAVTAPVTAAVSPAARPRPAAIRNEAYHAYSNSSPVTAVPVPAPSSSTSLDCQVPPGPASAAPTPTLRPTISTTARPMSAAAGNININNKSYHAYSSSNPVASASSASLDRLPPAAGAGAGAGAAVARRPSAMAARSHSYYGTTCTTPVLGPAAAAPTTTTTMAIPAAIPAVTPVVQNLAASASTSSLDRQIPVAQRSASMAANPRPATAAVTRRATSHAALPRPASAVAGSTSYYGNAGPGLVARRNTILFDGQHHQQQQPQTQGQSQGAQGQTGAEPATRPPRFYAMLRASMVVPDSVQIPTVEEETAAGRQRQSVYGPQPRPRSSRRSQWPRATSRLFTGSSMTDITDSDETSATDNVESRASVSCPSLLPASQQGSASSTTLSTPKTSGEDYKSQYRKTKTFPLEQPASSTPAAPAVPEKTTTATTTNTTTTTTTGTPVSKATSSPPRSSTAMSDFADLGTSARRAQSQARKLIKRNPSAPKPKLAPKPNAAQPSRSMSLAGAPPMPTSAPPSPPPLPRAMSIHIPPRSGSAAGAAKPTKTANKSKKLRLASLWSDLFRLRVSS